MSADDESKTATGSPSDSTPAPVPKRNPLENPVFTQRVGLFMSNAGLKNFAQTSSSSEEVSIRTLYEKRHIQFLQCVVDGKESEAKSILERCHRSLLEQSASDYDIQWMLTAQQAVTDRSNRTFNCSAYEYAYWANDTVICRMLELHMDEKTRAEMKDRIAEIERINTLTNEKQGLAYTQDGRIYRSARFAETDHLNRLEQSLQHYAELHKNQKDIPDWDALENAWEAAKQVEREFPVQIKEQLSTQVISAGAGLQLQWIAALKDLSLAQCAIVCEQSKDKLSQWINLNTFMKSMEASLSPAQCAVVFKTFVNKLPSLIKFEHDLEIFQYLTPKEHTALFRKINILTLGFDNLAYFRFLTSEELVVVFDQLKSNLADRVFAYRHYRSDPTGTGSIRQLYSNLPKNEKTLESLCILYEALDQNQFDWWFQREMRENILKTIKENMIACFKENPPSSSSPISKEMATRAIECLAVHRHAYFWNFFRKTKSMQDPSVVAYQKYLEKANDEPRPQDKSPG